MATATSTNNVGALQLLAEHPTWNFTQANKAVGESTSAWTTYLQGVGFSASDISEWLTGKLTASQLIAKNPTTGEGNSTGAGTAASQVADAAASAIPGVSSVAGLITILTNGSTWKGLGLVIAGAGILIFALIEFKNLAM
jgi:hypothetical protein